MCVKEFLGYNCGHCSVPYLRRCPLSSSNPLFPVCKHPAERPIFTNGYCHPCSRVVWNMKVLKDEEVHKERHLRGECLCEVVFDGEERERRMRPRGGKGKGKAVKTEHVGEGGGDYLGQNAGPQDIEARTRTEANGAVEAGPSCPQQGWESEAQVAAYAYVGYYVGQGQVQLNTPERAHANVQPQHTVWEGQLSAGREGAGMKWYPQESLPLLPPLPLPLGERFTLTPRYFPKARSEPTEKYSQLGPVEQLETPETPPQPMIVSSDMAST